MTREPEENLRAELQDAIAMVRKQIELEMISNHFIGSEQIRSDDINGLEAELAELQAALANLHSS